MVTAVAPPSIGTFHAVELKLRDWETALEQAARARRCDVDTEVYRHMRPGFYDRYGYADYAWVALDAGAIEPALENLDRFREAGVGLLAIAEGGVVVEHLDAVPPPTPIHSGSGVGGKRGVGATRRCRGRNANGRSIEHLGAEPTASRRARRVG